MWQLVIIFLTVIGDNKVVDTRPFDSKALCVEAMATMKHDGPVMAYCAKDPTFNPPFTNGGGLTILPNTQCLKPSEPGDICVAD